MNIAYLQIFSVDTTDSHVLIESILNPRYLLQFLLRHPFRHQILQFAWIQRLENLRDRIVDSRQQKYQLSLQNSTIVVFRDLFAERFNLFEMIHHRLRSSILRQMFDRLLDPNPLDRTVIIRPRQDRRFYPLLMAHLQKLLQEDPVDVLGPPPAEIDQIALPVLVELHYNLQTVDNQIRILRNGEIDDFQIAKFGNLTIRFVRSHHKLHLLRMERPHNGGNDPLIDNNTPREILPRLFISPLLQTPQPLLLILLLTLLSLLNRRVLPADIPSIEHANRFNPIIGEQIDHLEDVVEIVVGLDLLVELEGATVAPLVDPRHDVHRHRAVGERTYVLLLGYRRQQFQQAVYSHYRLIIYQQASVRYRHLTHGCSKYGRLMKGRDGESCSNQLYHLIRAVTI